MLNCTGDHSKHIVIQKDITIEFDPSTRKIPKNLEVIFKGKPKVKANLIASGNAQGGVPRWTLDSEICVCPDRDVPLTFHVSYFATTEKKRGPSLIEKFKRPKKIELGYNIIVQKLEEQDKRETQVPPQALSNNTGPPSVKIAVIKGSCTVSFEVIGGDIDSNIVNSSIEKLKPLLKDDFQDVIDRCTSDEFLDDIKLLSSILENIPVAGDVLDAIESAITGIADAHPLAKAVVTALSIPYKLMQNQSKLYDDVKTLAEKMRSTAKCVADVRDHTKIRSAKEELESITKTLRDAALYLNTYMLKGCIAQFVEAQFPKKLQSYAEKLDERTNSFRLALETQIAVGVDKIEGVVNEVARDVQGIASKEADDILQKHLKPVEDDKWLTGCLEGTRTNILKDIRDWVQLRDHASGQNILWLVGPPGAGKSTIANTIAKELADTPPLCVMFSCKRDVPDQRDPRRIWPTLAFRLAAKHAGFKMTLTSIVEKGNVQRYSVAEQFQNYLIRPLNANRAGKSSQSLESAYPVVIIDALDECYTSDDSDDDSGDGDWANLLQSLTCWPDLCKADVAKLIVTSRHRVDLSRKLDGLSRIVRLDTGDNASAESKADVGRFFEKRFTDMRSNLSLDQDWPGEQSINTLTNYAAGLFIWADMVVKYVGLDAAGVDPNERLREVLEDVQRPASHGIDGASRVDRLYARVVFEAFQHARSVELARAKSALATIVLAKEPLRFDDLVELLSTDSWNARNAINSTLRALRPIIPTDNVDGGVLRVCHKTVSDFLLSPSRSRAAMEHVADGLNAQSRKNRISNVHSYIIIPKEEEMNLALACVRLVQRRFSSNSSKVTPPLNQSLEYACNRWFEHLEGAGVVRMPGLKHLANAMKLAYRSLRRYHGKVSEMGTQEVALLEHLRDVSKFVDRCINCQQSEVENLQGGISQYAKNLDIIRGKFQIAMIEKSTSESPDSFLRKWLQPADQTVLDSPCLQGTRTSILQHAKDWFEGTNRSNILWMFGGPGAGKSAIATTLVGEFSKGGRLCAKVFAKRDSEDRRDPTRIWRTLAYDMAGLHAGFKGSLMEALWAESRQSEDPAENQLRFRNMVVKALKEQQCLSFVFVIDALDECFTEDNEQWRALLGTLSTCAKLPFKLVITSRDIPEIREVLEGISSCINLKPESDDMKEEARADLQVFLRTRFGEIPKDSGDAWSYWNQADIIHELIESADSFIWAKMVIELVKLKPHSRLDDILNLNNAGDGTNLKVDALYAKVLFDVLGPLPEKERELFRTVLAFVAFAKNPLRKGDLVELVRALPSFLSKDEKQVANMVKELSSVISIGVDEQVRIPHKSFVDFLLDRDHGRSLSTMKQILPAGSDPRSFIVNSKEDNANILIACLRMMGNTLEFNVCRITTSHILNDEIPGLEAHVSENIKPSLIYACHFWGEHLNDCSCDDQQFLGQVEPLLGNLLRENLLSWLEIMSLRKAVPSARRFLEIAEEVLKAYNNELAKVAEDACRFVEMFEEPIAAAVPHIYLSALPFCPPDSRIARTYGPRYMNVLSAVKGRLVGWNSAAQEPDAHTKGVNGIAFFPDGRKLASGSEDRTLRIWDAKMGEALSAPLTGHNDSVWSITVSSDGRKIASGDWDGVLRIWDSNTGACPLGSINAHSEVIFSLAFSPDGSRIVTGSMDKAVKVWNAATGDLCLGPLTGHTGDVNSVTFSIDGAVIASGSGDKTIRIWDARTGEPRGEPLTEHNGVVYCVAFSADGRYLASGSEDRTICLWDVEQGFSPTWSISVGSVVLSISFSPNGNCLVSGSENGVLCFWIVRSGTIEQIGDKFYGHGNLGGNTDNYMRSVAFAPDGQSVASCGDDRSRISRVPSSSALPPTTTMVREEYLSSAESLDARGHPVLDDSFIDDNDSFIDEDGWIHNPHGAGVLFWVPEKNRGGVWMPRNIVVIHPNVTKFDFRRFVHGEDWTLCRTSTDTEMV